eukprot:347411-Prymnesium_polylepis.1
MEGGMVPHPPFATLAGRSAGCAACQPPPHTKTRCPRVPYVSPPVSPPVSLTASATPMKRP